MTNSEFVRISVPEVGFGKKNLLNGQLELLKLAQSFHRFRVLRDEELILKVTLKNYLEEASKEIDRLERFLPRAEYKEKKEDEGDDEDRKKKLSLEEEIAKVRAKLSKLQEEI
ncbi:MAG: hypothetical protein KKD18_02910 [Nanoarchaeota archaeon]|nr:hypothetical protein [Nanoarchaeota archaeon]MBU0977340.1 hypothetical protein [Nanoarchaeota archaeon]